LISLLGVSGLMDAARSILGIEPVASGVVEDYVQDNAHAGIMSRSHQIGQVSPASKSGIDIQEVLNCIAVIAVLMGSLSEDGAEPKRRHSQVLQVSQLR